MTPLRPPLLVLVLVLATGCPADAPAPAPAPASPPASMTTRDRPRDPVPALVFAGETLGWLEPCGCAEGMLGGLPRRAAFLGQLWARGFQPIVLDGGDLVAEPGRQSELKLEAIAAAYARMKVAAVAVGERDVGRGADAAAPGGLALRPWNLRGGGWDDVAWRREIAGIGVAAYAAPAFALEYEARADGATLAPDPLPAGAAEVVLFHGSRDDARRAFADRKDVVVVYAGHHEELAAPPERLPGGAWLVTSGDKGKYAAVVELRRAAPGAPLAARPLPPAPLDDRVPDDPEVQLIVEQYKERLFEENLVASLSQRAPESGGQFVGPQTCASCHPKQGAVFERMKHTHSFESLKPRNGTRDPECLRCHTTGFGFESGFRGIEETPHLAPVSCESCHGVGSNHMSNPQPGFGQIKDPPRLCVQCHDKENSPRFHFPTYWEKIKH